MKKFRFRLDQVRRVSKIRERQAQFEAMKRQALAVAAERDAQERRAAVEVTELTEVTDLSTFSAERTKAGLRADAAERAEEVRRQAETELVIARDRWLEASRRARSLDQLEDRHRAAHAMVAARAAQRALDDLVRIRHKDEDGHDRR